MRIDVTIDDLAFVAADAIARPVNAELRAVTPVIRRLEQAAGDALLRQLHVRDPLEVGSAVVTGAGAVAADLMIHAVVCTDTARVTREGVRRALASALQRSHDFGVRRLALAPFGLGAGNLELEDAARTLAEALAAHEATWGSPHDVTIVVESALEAEVFGAALSAVGRTT